MQHLFPRSLTVLFMALTLASCAKGTGTSSEDLGIVSADLRIKAINDSCLDLQNIAAQMDHKDFAFPGFVYTRRFEIVSGAGSTDFTNNLYARSLRASSETMKSLPDIRRLKQTDCNTVSIPFISSGMLSYKITAASKSHLEVELMPESLKAVVEKLPELQRQTITKFPTIKKYTFRVASPNQLEITSTYNSIPGECTARTSAEIREELVYRWTYPDRSVDTSVQLNKTYWEKLKSLAQGSVPEAAATEVADLVSLDVAAVKSLQEGLRAGAHASCF